MKCAVVNCNKSNEGKSSAWSFFRFPSNSTLRNKWISFCGRNNFNVNTAFICMHHFKAEDFANNLQYEMGFATKRLLKDGVIPTINSTFIQNEKLHEQRKQRIGRREDKKIVNLLLENHSSALMPSLGSNSLEHDTNIKSENINETRWQQPEQQVMKTPSSGVSGFHNLNLKVKTLEQEILFLRNEQKLNDAALKKMKEQMEKIETIQKNDMKKVKKCLAKTKFELESVEEKLQVIFTKGQIKKLKNGNKRQIWSEEDIAHSINLYAENSQLYRHLYRNQFPLPAVRTLQSWTQKSKSKNSLISNESNEEIVQTYN